MVAQDPSFPAHRRVKSLRSRKLGTDDHCVRPVAIWTNIAPEWLVGRCLVRCLGRNLALPTTRQGQPI